MEFIISFFLPCSDFTCSDSLISLNLYLYKYPYLYRQLYICPLTHFYVIVAKAILVYIIHTILVNFKMKEY